MPKNIFYAIDSEIRVDYIDHHIETPPNPDGQFSSLKTLEKVARKIKAGVLDKEIARVDIHSHGELGKFIIGKSRVHPMDFIKMVCDEGVEQPLVFNVASCAAGRGLKAELTNFDEEIKQDIARYAEIPEGVSVIINAGHFDTIAVNDEFADKKKSFSATNPEEIFLGAILNPETATIIFNRDGECHSFKSSAPREDFSDEAVGEFLINSMRKFMGFFRNPKMEEGFIFSPKDSLLLDKFSAIIDDEFIKKYKQNQFEIEISRKKFTYASAIIDSGIDPESMAESGYEMFFDACVTGEINLVEYFLNLQNRAGEFVIDFNSIAVDASGDGNTPLSAACNEDNYEIVKKLLEKVDEDGNPIILPNKAASDGRTPFFIACENGSTEAARVLLDHQKDGRYVVDIDQGISRGTTPLLVAIMLGHSEIAELTLKGYADRGMAVDLNSEIYGGSLSSVIDRSDPDMLAVIVANGININKDKPLKTILDHFKLKRVDADTAENRNNHLKMMAVLIANGASVRFLKSEIEENGELFSVVANLSAAIRKSGADKKRALQELFTAIDDPKDLLDRYSDIKKISVNFATGNIAPPPQAFFSIKTSPLVLAGASAGSRADVPSPSIREAVAKNLARDNLVVNPLIGMTR